LFLLLPVLQFIKVISFTRQRKPLLQYSQVKKQHLILLTAGIMLAAIILGSRGISEPQDVIKPGDKGNDVLGMQNAFSNLTGVRLDNKGAYDNETLAAVQCLLRGSNALKDYDRGYVDRKFASDLWRIQNNARM
jgi:hypothetical protein